MNFFKKWVGGVFGTTPQANASEYRNLPQAIAEAVKSALSGGGAPTPSRALQIAAVYACVRLIAGAVATLPLHIKERKPNNERHDASETEIWRLLRKRPNRWQTPSQFKRLLQTHLLLRGNAYAMIVWSVGKRIVELVPLNPDRVTIKQRADNSLEFHYQRKNGGKVILQQRDVLHLVGFSEDGVRGVSPLEYARKTVGLALSMESHGLSAYENGARVSNVIKHPGALTQEAFDRLKASIDSYRDGGEQEGKSLILEEGMDIGPMSMTAQDLQWIESRKFSRTEIAMFFGVPPHMIGDTEKSTSWGSGIEQQGIGFVTYTLEDHLTTWEEAIDRDLIADRSNLYARFNRAALVKGDIKTRWEAYTKALSWGVYSPNEIRALEDMNPRTGGDIFYPPPNTAGNSEPIGEPK